MTQSTVCGKQRKTTLVSAYVVQDHVSVTKENGGLVPGQTVYFKGRYGEASGDNGLQQGGVVR